MKKNAFVNRFGSIATSLCVLAGAASLVRVDSLRD
jgi:hypothetical protein